MLRIHILNIILIMSSINCNLASKITKWAIVVFVFIVFIKLLRQSLSSFWNCLYDNVATGPCLISTQFQNRKFWNRLSGSLTIILGTKQWIHCNGNEFIAMNKIFTMKSMQWKIMIKIHNILPEIGKFVKKKLY